MKQVQIENLKKILFIREEMKIMLVKQKLILIRKKIYIHL